MLTFHASMEGRLMPVRVQWLLVYIVPYSLPGYNGSANCRRASPSLVDANRTPHHGSITWRNAVNTFAGVGK